MRKRVLAREYMYVAISNIAEDAIRNIFKNSKKKRTWQNISYI
jgi:hypothetical protein